MKKYLHFWVSIVAAVICFSVFALSLGYPSFQARIDEHALWILLIGVACLLVPFVSKLKIGTLFEVERLESTVKQLIKGEVLRSPRGESFYVDGEGKRFGIPDRQTIEFLSTSRGPILMSEAEIDEYPLRGQLDSVLTCKIMKEIDQGHLFAVLNGKKYYISSWSPVLDWNRKTEDFVASKADTIRAIPTGR